MKNIKLFLIIIMSVCVYTPMYTQEVYIPVTTKTSELVKIGENYYQTITRFVGEKVWYEEKIQLSNFPEVFVTPLLMLQKSDNKPIKKIKNIQFIKRIGIPFNKQIFYKCKRIKKNRYYNWNRKSQYVRIK